MGACASKDDVRPTHGDLVFVNLATPDAIAGNTEETQAFHLRTGMSAGPRLAPRVQWASFNCAGVLVDSQQGLEAIIVRPYPEQLLRVPLDLLLGGKSPDVKSLAVAPLQPALSTMEHKCVAQFAAQAGNVTEPGQRVRILSAKGRKALVPKLVADMLVAMGRHVKQADAVYRARYSSWAMPDITYLVPPTHSPQGSVTNQVSNKRLAEQHNSVIQRRSSNPSEATPPNSAAYLQPPKGLVAENLVGMQFSMEKTSGPSAHRISSSSVGSYSQTHGRLSDAGGPGTMDSVCSPDSCKQIISSLASSQGGSSVPSAGMHSSGFLRISDSARPQSMSQLGGSCMARTSNSGLAACQQQQQVAHA